MTFTTPERSRRHPGAGRRAFTLVEILIVVLIIGMLLSIAAPAFVRAREGTYARACQHNLKQIMGAKERWAMDQNMGADAAPSIKPDLVPDFLREPETTCPAGGTYTIGNLATLPVCSLGGTPGEFNAHVLP
jgi:prepilin-type N-terminal cleavage/methylation domain-containing protein